MLRFVVLFVLGFVVSEAKVLDDIMNKLTKKEQEECTALGNAELMVTNKLEGSSKTISIEVGKEVQYETLVIKGVKCCFNEGDQSYLFLVIENLKIKKQVFKSWMFSKQSSLTGLEDPKFDVTLLKCF